MQEELTIGGGGGFGEQTEEESAPTTLTRKPRRSPRALWRSLSDDRRISISCVVFAVTVVGLLYGSAFSALAIWEHNGRTQAVHRAMKMDGEVYTITNVATNWVGDTRLFLKNERGEDAGWVMINTNNPLTSDVHPLFLYFSEKRYDPLPFPMRVRAHFRRQPWVVKVFDREKTYENYTGSFLQFEKLDAEPN